jgi:putative tryptophan/tyrosine transport system substrate-binding protein
MRRRDFIALVGGATAWPLAARAQQPARMPRIGILLFSEQDRAVIDPMLRGLEALGYIDGKTVTIVYRSFEGEFERLPKVIDELIRLNPDVIFSFGGEQALFLKKAIATIPIVVVVSNDPVATGLVPSLARPGGNITGLTYVNDQLSGKTVELLKEVAPSVSRAAVFWDPDHADPEFLEMQRAAPALSSPLKLQSLQIREPADFDGAFAAAIRERAEAVIVIGARGLFLHKQLIGDFAAKNRLILVGTPAWLTPIGGLLSYGADAAEIHRLAAGYLDKILKGAKPSDLPMQQPATFELVINLKSAKTLGLAIPPTLIARADRVIE